MSTRTGLLLAFSTLSLFSGTASSIHDADDDLLINTENFVVQGVTWPNNSHVNFWGRIPYAEPPFGTLRFRPPITKSASSEVINGSEFGPACIQWDLPGQSEYEIAFQSEDCLTLNVWAPKGIPRKYSLPVMIWVPGGGHQVAGANIANTYGDRLAQDQHAIVISMNYRLNIFGYPGAFGLNGENLNPGLLDQRKAVEWIHENVHAFGGDPENMILFGQSAGGSSIEMYTYAYPSDPIVKGFISQSGVISISGPGTGSDFSYVATQVGCGDVADNDAELQCMQEADAQSIIAVYNTYNATLNGGRSLSFGPTPDNQTHFSNYTDLQIRGLFARQPMLYSQTDDEGTNLIPPGPTGGVNQTAAAEFTAFFATCPGNQVAAAKAAFGVPVWRVRYFGIWPNLNPVPELGTYHGADIPMIFGTSNLTGPDTERQRETSKYMQNAWAAFARDPANGLIEYGWPTYVPSAKTLIELGVEGTSEAIFVAGDAYSEYC